MGMKSDREKQPLAYALTHSDVFNSDEDELIIQVYDLHLGETPPYMHMSIEELRQLIDEKCDNLSITFEEFMAEHGPQGE